jgi:hypothetical protein
MAAPTEMDYTNRDYDSIRAFLVTTARTVMPDWATAGEPGDFGTLLLELFSVAGDGLNYYIDRVGAEPFLQTAVRRQSLLAIADLLGYVPVAQQAASVQVTFTLDDDKYLDYSIEIPAGTVVQTQGDKNAGNPPVLFETTGALTLGVAVRSGITGATEGRSVVGEYSGVSNGAPLQDFLLANAGVIERSMSVKVTEANGSQVAWDFVDRLTDAGPSASVYATYTDDIGYSHIRFGDGVSGRIPPVNATINANYRYGQGAAGNVATSTINTISPGVPGVSVVNNTPAAGGADPESIDNMRYGIPRAAHTLDRAVTLSDFESLCLQVPGVAKATAYGTYYTMVHVPIAPVGGGLPSSALKGRVQRYLQDRMMIGASCIVEDPDYEDCEVTIIVHVLPSFGQENTRFAVQEAVKALFDFTAVSFGTRISIGDVFRTAMEQNGVDYIELTKLRIKGHVPLIEDIVPSPLQLPELLAADTSITAVGGLT